MNVVWLHGFPAGPAMWDTQLTKLGGIAPKLIQPEARTVDAMADLALAAADDAGYDTFAVVGLSLGGYVAFRLFETVSQRVTALVLADTRAEPDTADARAGRDHLIRAIRRDGPKAAVGFLQKVAPPDRNPDIFRLLEGMALEHEPQALAAAVEALRDRPDSRPLLPRIRCPTLVVVGRDDEVTPPETARAMEALIPRARLVEVDGGHFANLDAEQEFTAHVSAFLEAPVAPRPGFPS